MDRQRFHEIAKRIEENGQAASAGIGTLGEKRLHAVLKQYFEPDIDKREVKIGGYIADIVRENTIIEIQTRSFDRLRPKLDAYLDAHQVTVVYPIPRVKWISWIDREEGTISKRRKSPKTGTICDAFYELYKIKKHLTHPNLHLCFVMLEVDEYRYLNGWSRDKKRGSSRCERIPIDIYEEIEINKPSEYVRLVPDSLATCFTSKDFETAAKISRSCAQRAINVLHFVGAIERKGKKKNLYVYERAANGHCAINRG